jgi:predicted dehydrogenase
VKNVGIVGLGKMGILHAGIINSMEHVRVKAISEKDGIVFRLARNFLPKTIALYRDHMKMVENEELDAVFITTPIASHAPLALDLLQENPDLGLFIEKPLASSSEQARMICEVAGRMRGINMVGFQKRFSPLFQRVKQLVDQGSIGELMFFRAYSFSSDVLREGESWRSRRGTGGVLLDLAPHLVDLLLWFFGEPDSILAVKSRLYSRDVEDYVHAVVSFRSGLKGHMDACWSISSFRLPEISVEIHGKKGSLTVTDDFVKLDLNRKNGLGSVASKVYYKQSFDTSVSFLLADPEYTLEDEAFFRGLQEPKSPEPSFFQAAKVNATIDQIHENAK